MKKKHVSIRLRDYYDYFLKWFNFSLTHHYYNWETNLNTTFKDLFFIFSTYLYNKALRLNLFINLFSMAGQTLRPNWLKSVEGGIGYLIG